jgi:Zn-finger nucleic acid-binding protein/DNA-directed RNA polymerase subunit RPC12/RpoP
MTCANCGAPMRLDRGKCLMVCDYCLSEANPPVDEDGVQIAGPTSHRCPTCGDNLADGLIERAPVLYCQACHGMLISIEKFLPLIEHLRALRDRPAAFLSQRGEEDAGRSLACPMCGQPMNTHPYGGGGNVNIETCETCSRIWLDRHELRRIVVAADPLPLYSKYDPDREFSSQ